MKKIGITGTREGMTEKQMLAVGRFLVENRGEWKSVEFHHGDCVGVDIQAAKIASAVGYKVVCHPPIAKSHRGYHNSDIIHSPMDYLARDRKIVEEVELLLVVPKQDVWHPIGGTWYTHDYAVKRGIPVKLFWPTKDSQ